MGLLGMFGFKKKTSNRIINRDPNNLRDLNGLSIGGNTGLASSKLSINLRQSSPLMVKPRTINRINLK